MAKKRRKKSNKIISALIIAVFLAVVAFLQGQDVLPETVNPNVDGKVYLHIIDVGQGSSTLVQQGNAGICINSEERACYDTVDKYRDNFRKLGGNHGKSC